MALGTAGNSGPGSAVSAEPNEVWTPHPGSSTAIGRNVPYRIGKFVELVSGSWLDFGCADGGYAAELLRVGAKHVTGVDVDPDRIAMASARDLDEASFTVFDGEHLPFEDDEFDGAFVNEVMEHVVDEKHALRELRRVLRPDATLVVISPNRWFPYECHGVHVGSWKYPRPAPFVPWLPKRLSNRMLAARNYWPGELADLVAGAGFRIEQLGFIWPVLEVDEYNWLPERATKWYVQRMKRLDSIPVLRRFGVSTMVIARPSS
jgi:ubiquinone/menaquinone biosynthesis C-methylase UbiE